MTDSHNEYFCCSSLNCRNLRVFFGNVKAAIAGCYNSTKNCSLCTYFSFFTSDDLFVDLEKGVHDNTFSREKVFHKEPVIKNGDVICANCSVKKADVVILPCGHSTFCNDCLEEWSEKNANCPLCGIAMTDVVQCI